MFLRQATPTARIASRLVARRPAPGLIARRSNHTQPEGHNPLTSFFREVPMPLEAYPLAGMVVIMLGWAGYHSVKHIREDRDHLRWYPGAGGVKYAGPDMEDLPVLM